MEELALRSRIRGLLAEGRLPRQCACRIIAGYGDGKPCEICGGITRPSQVVYEARFGGAETLQIRMHYECFELWCSERALRRERDLHSAA